MNFPARMRVVKVTLWSAALAAGIEIPGPSPATGAVAADAGATFKAKCASCHGVDGGGQTAKGKELKIRDMRSAEVQKMSDEQLYKITAKGKGKMPGYEKSLGADQVKELVAHIRGLGKTQ